MRGASLLSRIRRPETAQPRRAVSEREVRDSILANLIAMCGTRVGTMLTCPDFGIADVSEMVYSFPDAITLMASTLKHTIQTYEPRLQNVQVVHVPNDGLELTLRFEIRARIVGDANRQSIKFETTLDPSRRLSIR
jgi:type VI secretion system protein